MSEVYIVCFMLRDSKYNRIVRDKLYSAISMSGGYRECIPSLGRSVSRDEENICNAWADACILNLSYIAIINPSWKAVDNIKKLGFNLMVVDVIERSAIRSIVSGRPYVNSNHNEIKMSRTIDDSIWTRWPC